jgi:hypothetical protein
VSSVYLFLMAMLIYGLPLLTAYANVNSTFYSFILIPYIAMLLSMALKLILISRANADDPPKIEGQKSKENSFISRLNSISPYFVISSVSLATISYSVMKFLANSTYPYPPPHMAEIFGVAYIVLLVVSSILVLARVIYLSFPILSRILMESKYASMASVCAATFAIVYLLLVGQIVVIGYNEPWAVPPPNGLYPFFYVFTVGPQQPFINFIYTPYLLVQITPMISVFIIPFEMIFAPLLALLTASNITMTYYLIKNNGLRCCTKGTVMSTGGSILGLTATCPTCLIPSFVSVIFGGITAGEAVYSNVYGAVLPPILSVATLFLSLAYLSKSIKEKEGLVSHPQVNECCSLNPSSEKKVPE